MLKKNTHRGRTCKMADPYTNCSIYDEAMRRENAAMHVSNAQSESFFPNATNLVSFSAGQRNTKSVYFLHV